MTLRYSDDSPEGIMGGKRPDQHNIDPGEAGSSDYKWRHEGRSESEHLAEKEKQHLASNPRGHQPLLPEENVNPALRELRERKQQAKEKPAEPDDDDARVEEASQESFPASDPPAY